MGKTFAIKSGTVQRQANYRRKISPQMKTGERERERERELAFCKFTQSELTELVQVIK